jgi:CHAD domain-containing protein
VQTILERELKLDADPGFVLPDLDGEPLAPRVFTSTYYDTADRRLLRSGVTLRRRVENRAGLWQLKLPSAEGRYELEAPGGPSRPPDAFLRLLPALLRRGATLEQAARLRTRRSGVAVADGDERIEVTLDTVAVLDGRRVASSFVEVEAEAVAGNGTGLGALGKALRKAGARRGGGLPKVRRVLLFEEAERAAESTDPATRLRRLVVQQYEELLANDPGVRLGEDPEALHKARVATRRSRALLRAARDLVSPDWAEPLRAELSWLGGLLGPVRDVDVLLEHLDAQAASLEGEDAKAFERLRSRLAGEREDARAALLEAMTDDRYFRLLDTLERAGEAPATASTVPLPEIAARAFSELRKAASALPKRPSDDQLHRIRIKTKRARYAAELGKPALGKSGARFVKRARAVQDLIGEHQDAVVAEERIRELALRGGSRTALAAGRLIEQQRLRKQDARQAFPQTWRKLEQAGRAAFR